MNALVIAPHPDDEVLGCGGMIAETKPPDRVNVVILCGMRAYRHRYSKKVFLKNLDEIEQARLALGYENVRVYDYLDERLEEQKIKALATVERLMEEWTPNTVFIPHHGDLNQDHVTASWIGSIVARPPAVKLLAEYEIPGSSEYGQSERFKPNFYVTLSDRSAEKKIDALECYVQEKRGSPNLRSPILVRLRMLLRGSEAYVKYAEAFRIVRAIIKP